MGEWLEMVLSSGVLRRAFLRRATTGAVSSSSPEAALPDTGYKQEQSLSSYYFSVRKSWSTVFPGHIVLLFCPSVAST
jgi:hypothetical protein